MTRTIDNSIQSIQIPVVHKVTEAIEKRDIDTLCSVELNIVRRSQLDSLEETDENREMLNAAKLLISLKEVQLLERAKLLPSIQLLSSTNVVMAFVNLHILSFKHLITVPNKHSLLAADEVYQQAFKDAEKVDHEMLQRIYEISWSKISFSPNVLNLMILEPLQDWSFPDYAFTAIGNGLIKRYDTIQGIAFPFGLDEVKLKELCKVLSGKVVGEMCLTLRPEISLGAIEEFVTTIRGVKLAKLTLLGLKHEYYTIAYEIAAKANIDLTLGESPYAPLEANVDPSSLGQI